MDALVGPKQMSRNVGRVNVRRRYIRRDGAEQCGEIRHTNAAARSRLSNISRYCVCGTGLDGGADLANARGPVIDNTVALSRLCHVADLSVVSLSDKRGLDRALSKRSLSCWETSRRSIRIYRGRYIRACRTEISMKRY